MRPRLIAVPYDSGHRGLRMGAGPLDLLAHDAAGRIGAAPATVLEAGAEWRAEGGTGFELNRALSAAVRQARAAGERPLVLAGNCATALGTVAGLDGDAVGVLWLDAHADLNTPETSHSAFMDGMALSIVLGRCWRAAAEEVPGFRPVPEGRVALLGARELDPAEEEVLAASAITRVTVGEVARDAAAAVTAAVGRLRDAGARRLYLHLDLDVHDAGAVRANQYAAPGGLRPEQTLAVIHAAAAVLPIAAAAITAYDPSASPDGSGRAVAMELLAALSEP